MRSADAENPYPSGVRRHSPPRPAPASAHRDVEDFVVGGVCGDDVCDGDDDDINCRPQEGVLVLVLVLVLVDDRKDDGANENDETTAGGVSNSNADAAAARTFMID